MISEERFFLQVLADFIQGCETKLPAENLDWELLLQKTEEQALVGILYCQCREILKDEKEILGKLHDGFMAGVFYAACQNKDLEEITEAFSKEEIPFIPMKGTVIAEYYPIWQMRSKGDIDIIIHSSDRKKSHELMDKMGFECMVDNHAVWTYHRDIVTYEIHDHMMYEPLANQINYREYFDHIWEYARKVEGSSRYDLNENFHFLYLMTHTAKHILNKGYGIRAFLDLVFFTRAKGETMDWQWITEQLTQLQLLEFTKICFSLCERWFDVKMPIPPANITEEFFEQTTEKIFRDGLWGFENKDNQVGVSAKTISRSKLPYWITAVNMTRKKLFPSYRDMQLIPWYSFVDGRPWLLPAAWIYRFWYCVRNKKEYGTELLSEPFTKVKEIHEREELMKAWGL